jgi:hypothetical protein
MGIERKLKDMNINQPGLRGMKMISGFRLLYLLWWMMRGREESGGGVIEMNEIL